MFNKKGFTLTELIIVVVVVAVLALISLPMYRKYVRQAVASEGKALLGEVAAAQEIYFSRFGRYFAGSVGQQFSGAFGIDARRNKYFRGFNVTSGGSAGSETYSVDTAAENIELTLDGSRSAAPVTTEKYN